MSEEKHIILIDDDPIIHMSCELMLFGTNYKKTSITDPDEALLYQKNKNKYEKPDLLLVDLMMGKISGIDVIRSIRTDTDFNNIPIILYTGYPHEMMQEPKILKELNITAVLSKPILKEHFLSKINFYINL